MGQGHRTFRMRGEGKRMEINIHGTNPPADEAFAKERSMTDRKINYNTLFAV
jgi:hypothetical protein